MPTPFRFRSASAARALSCVLPFTVLLAGCGDSPTTPTGNDTATRSLRVINAFTSPVDLLVDGAVVASAVAPGAIHGVTTVPGAHTLTLRPANGAAVTHSVTTTSDGLSTLAVVRAAGGAVAVTSLDDSNSVVPAGATKMRVLHLAANAGAVQVYRTQPDASTPVAWQTPFTYQSTVSSLTAPFYQSTVGTWDVRIWQTPADASGWQTAPTSVTLPLQSGERRTILILDKEGGGIRVTVL